MWRIRNAENRGLWNSFSCLNQHKYFDGFKYIEYYSSVIKNIQAIFREYTLDIPIQGI